MNRDAIREVAIRELDRLLEDLPAYGSIGLEIVTHGGQLVRVSRRREEGLACKPVGASHD